MWPLAQLIIIELGCLDIICNRNMRKFVVKYIQMECSCKCTSCFVNMYYFGLLRKKTKSVRFYFAYGKIALTLELLGRFGRFLDEDDRCNPPVLLVPFFEAPRALNQNLTV